MFHSQEEMSARASRHYDAQKDDRNERMARDPSRVNNHMGIGYHDGVLSPGGLSQEQLTRILDDLENNQTAYLIERMGAVGAQARVLDVGCGRGGPAFTLHERTGCFIDGVTISAYQCAYASAVAETKGVGDRVRFHLMNYVDLRFADGSFDHAFSNETTMHAFDLGTLFAELHRVVRRGGRYTLATWAANEAFAHNEYLEPINRHYQCLIHSREDYVSSLVRRGFEIVAYDDLTDLAIPYWQLRCQWSQRSGIEHAFLEGHRSRKLLYLMISGTRERR
jgi:geranyl diphosphate 2-C-methyltransferase